MIVNDMRGWMAEFAMGITDIPPEDTQWKLRVVELYKQSALSFSKEMSDSIMMVDDDFSNVGAVWERDPVVLDLDPNVSTDGAVWVEPSDPIDIKESETSLTEIGSVWSHPKDPVNIGFSNGLLSFSDSENWVKPKDAIDIDVSKNSIYAVWADPSIWGY